MGRQWFGRRRLADPHPGSAAAIITVVGLAFSITIVALTLASTQFGPRILRNFTRYPGTQLTLGTFVATFVFVVLDARIDCPRRTVVTLSRTSPSPSPWALALVDLAVLVYFIHHVATSIQLPHVIASIARDLTTSIDVRPAAFPTPNQLEAGLSETEVIHR